jgi:hypothetical protein
MIWVIFLTACATRNVACMEADTAATSCPAAEDVDPADLWPTDCALAVVAVTGEGELADVSMDGLGEGPMECCYPVLSRGRCEY